MPRCPCIRLHRVQRTPCRLATVIVWHCPPEEIMKTCYCWWLHSSKNTILRFHHPSEHSYQDAKSTYYGRNIKYWRGVKGKPISPPCSFSHERVELTICDLDHSVSGALLTTESRNADVYKEQASCPTTSMALDPSSGHSHKTRMWAGPENSDASESVHRRPAPWEIIWRVVLHGSVPC